MSDAFFEKPILNSPYYYPRFHWELDDDGQPTERTIPTRRKCSYVTPVPKPKKRKGKKNDSPDMFEEKVEGIKIGGQIYDQTSIINEVRSAVDSWRQLKDPKNWGVTPETARLLQHWRHHKFNGVRPFFCQVEAVETAIWLTEVAPKQPQFKKFRSYLEATSAEANPDLFRLALKLATGAGKTTVMAMIIAWQTINANRRPGSKQFSNGFVIVAPGITIRDRLRVLLPNDSESYYLNREIIPEDSRGLRRQSYELNSEGLFDVEYSDILGIPFDFTAKPVIAKPKPPKPTVRVHAVRPERDALELTFPRVTGYRTEIPEGRLTASFTDDSTFTLTPDIVGPSRTVISGIVGKVEELNVQHLKVERQSTILFKLTTHLIETKYRDENGELQLHLFGQLKRIVRQWLDNHFVCKGDTVPAQILIREMANEACNRIVNAINGTAAQEAKIQALLDPYNPTGSTSHVNFNTSKDTWKTRSDRSHINLVVTDSDWEAQFARAAEAHPAVLAYAKNQGLGLEVPYLLGSDQRRYLPDFLLKVDDGRGPDDLLNLIVEIKGYRGEDAKAKADTMRAYWIPGVNNLKKFGRWAFAEFTQPFSMDSDLSDTIAASISTSLAKLKHAETVQIEL